MNSASLYIKKSVHSSQSKGGTGKNARVDITEWKQPFIHTVHNKLHADYKDSPQKEERLGHISVDLLISLAGKILQH